MTSSGLNYVVSMGLLGDISRFTDGDLPSSCASPPIAATTRSHHHAGQQSGSSPAAGTDYAIRLSECFPAGAFLRRLNKRKNRSVAITALVRKLVTIVFLLLKSSKSYRYANPDLMRQKFTKLEGSSQAIKSRQRSRCHLSRYRIAMGDNA